MNTSLLKILLLLFCMGAFWCFADNFLVTEKPQPRRTTHKIKQEIIDQMGSLLELESDVLAVKAKVQKMLCQQIRAFAEGDKKSSLVRAHFAELQRILTMLKQENTRQRKELAAEERFLASLTSTINS